MKALVLSAGYGERLRPLTDTTPKPLLEIGGRPLIHYPLLMLRQAGITEVAINLHHLGRAIEEALGDGAALGLRITYSYEPTLAGTGGPLAILRDYFGGDRFVMLNCDTILDLDLSALLDFHVRKGGLATFVLRTSVDSGAYSQIECGSDARIRRMRLLKGRSRGLYDDYPATLERQTDAGVQPYMYCGVMACEPGVCSMIKRPPPFSLMGDLFAPLLAQNTPLYGYVHDGFFRTVDDRAGYEDVRAEFGATPPRLRYLDAAANPPR
ncbi:MAG: NDP-sugar synthase [Candidatus Binataceae bacterium]